MKIELLKNKLLESRKKKSAIFLKKYIDVDVNWEYIIEEINLCFTYKPISEFPEEHYWRQIGGIAQERMFYIQLISNFPSRNEKINKIADDFAKLFYNEQKYPRDSLQYFINLVPYNKELGIKPNANAHYDNWDVVFLQLIGKSTWNIYQNEKDTIPIQSETVEPGDIILIPKGVIHEIYAQTPRVGCSIGYPEL